MMQATDRAREKLRKCLALANDERGDSTPDGEHDDGELHRAAIELGAKMHTLEQARRKLAKTLALAQDERGDPTTRETAKRQAEALMRRPCLRADGTNIPVPPPVPIDWSTRTSAEAAAAGLLRSVQCIDGIFVP
jgi:hypothetical protein